MKKNLLVLGAALTLLLTLSACGRQTVIRTTDTLDQAEPEASAAEPLLAEPAAGRKKPPGRSTPLLLRTILPPIRSSACRSLR